MTYLEAIKTALLLFPFIAFFFTFFYILHQYHRYGSIHKLRTLIVYSFILYMITIYFLTILPLPSMESVSAMTGPTMNLIPFSFVTDFLKETAFQWNDPTTYLQIVTEPAVYTVLFNIVMTIPFGMYLKYYFRVSTKKVVLYTFLLSLFFEITQLTGLYFIYPRPYRLFDVDDLLTNTLGGLLGTLFIKPVSKVLPSRKEIDRKSREEGMKISVLRRLTYAGLDFFLFLIFWSILEVFFSYSFNKYIAIISYYVGIPLLRGGRTPAGTFLNIAIVPTKPISLLTRILFLGAYYIGIPLLISILFRNIHITSIAGILILLFYGVNLWQLRKRPPFYEKLLKVELKSTIEVEKENET